MKAALVDFVFDEDAAGLALLEEDFAENGLEILVTGVGVADVRAFIIHLHTRDEAA